MKTSGVLAIGAILAVPATASAGDATDLSSCRLLLTATRFRCSFSSSLKMSLPGGLANRLAPRVQLVSVLGVIRIAAPAVAGVAVRLSPARLAAVDAEAFLLRHNTASGAGFRVAGHQRKPGEKRRGKSSLRGSGVAGFFRGNPYPPHHSRDGRASLRDRLIPCHSVWRLGRSRGTSASSKVAYPHGWSGAHLP